MDLIEREKVKAAIREKFKTLHERTEINMIMNEQPAVDAAPVVHAHWISWDEVVGGHFHEISECSKCSFTTDRLDREGMKYCLNCGAKMDEKDGNHDAID